MEGTANVQQAKEEEKGKEEQQKGVGKGVEGGKGYCFDDKIKWSNVGYQYPKMKTDFPSNIGEMSERANRLYNCLKQEKKEYFAESAIINYYGEKDYMTGHLDDAEIDQTSPIYTFSFGLSCIFLVGGSTKDTRPVAVRLNSGDLFIMSGESRLAYHGVPRILSHSFLCPQKVELQPRENWANGQQQVDNYIRSHRLNINVRQIYPSEPRQGDS